MPTPLVVARCGDLQNAPESTLPAFAGAIKKGADVIEFDVHLSTDGCLVVHHDYYLGRTNTGRGHIGDYSLTELRALDAGSWFNTAFAGISIPVLSEIFDLGKGKTRFEIDMRCPSLPFLRLLLDEIARFDIRNDVELTSSHIPLLFHARQTNSQLRTGVFFRPIPDWMETSLGQSHVLGWMQLMDAQVAHLPSSLIDQPFVTELHQNRYLVHGSNLNTDQEVRAGIMAGIDQFSTDRLEMALQIRHEMQGQ